MQIQLLDDAEQDLLNGYNFYESQVAGLGEYFLDSLYSDIDSLLIYAGIHKKHFGFHRMLSKRFPFAIYYLPEGNIVSIYSILDCRKEPGFHADRLS